MVCISLDCLEELRQEEHVNRCYLVLLSPLSNQTLPLSLEASRQHTVTMFDDEGKIETIDCIKIWVRLRRRLVWDNKVLEGRGKFLVCVCGGDVFLKLPTYLICFLYSDTD